MPRRFVLRVVCLISMALCYASVARAQDRHTAPGVATTPETETSAPMIAVERPKPSIVLTSLYATTILVQGLDAHSTFRALDTGARESNPVIGSLAGNKAGFLALKAGIATASIYAAHSLARRNKVAAIAALVAVNTGYALIVRSNYHVAGAMTAAAR
jgi:hypothetical protein